MLLRLPDHPLGAQAEEAGGVRGRAGELLELQAPPGRQVVDDAGHEDGGGDQEDEEDGGYPEDPPDGQGATGNWQNLLLSKGSLV